MYAIYKPNDTTTRTAGVIRDITRLITENSTANLEFHDANVTQIIDNTTPSGWSLPTGTSFSTDATPGINDTRYVMQANSRIGSNKKYCSLKTALGIADSRVYNANIATMGIKLSGVFDYGGANEYDSAGRSDYSSSAPPHHGIGGAATGIDMTIHIFATQDSITIVGADNGGRINAETITEFADNTLTQLYRNNNPTSVPVARIQRKTNFQEDNSSGARLQRYYGDNSSNFGQNFTQLLQCICLPNGSEYYRNFVMGWTHRFHHFAIAATTENNTTTGGTSTIYNYADIRKNWLWQDTHASLNSSYRGDVFPTTYASYRKDGSGNNILPLYPLVMSLDFINPGEVYDLSQYSGVYNTRRLLGAAHGDTITIGSDVYVYFQNGSLEFVVKVQ